MADTPPKNKAWSGRFSEAVDELVKRYTASVDFDKRLAIADITGSLAHARMLARQGIIAAADLAAIESGMAQITGEVERNEFVWSVDDEDVHLNIEKRLTALVGDAGKRLHTGRSRNDQVATDIRLYLRGEIDRLCSLLRGVQRSLLEIAERNAATIMPGFTHLQVAQPVTFGHHMLAYFEMFDRDYSRLVDCRKRMNRLPLGACSLAMVHISRLSEELILWMSPRFGFITLADRFCTGSSIMPQKKNPDVPELARGKTGRVLGHLVGLMTLMKGQPLAYNKDNQEDKEPLFDTIDTLGDTLTIFADMIGSIQVKPERMRAAALEGFSTATDLADYLVKKGLPFRDAHEAVARAVRHAEGRGVDLADLTLKEMRDFSPLVDADIGEVLTLEGSTASRNHVGGTAPAQVLQAIARARTRVA